MPLNDAFILTLAYPETIVPHAKEWYSKYLRYFFIGNKSHVRAGHAALVLIQKTTGNLEYYDFGRYVTSYPNGRVRGKTTDFELDFPIFADIQQNKIENLDSILKFLATHPKLIHGDGNMYASICDAVNYNLARNFINTLHNQGFVRYGAFIKKATNCARFVTDVLIASTTNPAIKKNLQRSKWFTPSTIGNVVIADTEKFVYLVSDRGEMDEFKSSISKENLRLFFDRLKSYYPSLEGNLIAKPNEVKSNSAQWLCGIGCGAWFEVFDLGSDTEYRYRRISPYGTIDCDGIYKINKVGFDIRLKYKFKHYSNCSFFHIEQNKNQYHFQFVKNYLS